MSLPQVPEILLGLRDMDCILAILVETGWNSSRNWLQQKGRPQMPMPPSILASSRTPIWRSSMRLRNTEARSLTSSRKSTRPSEVKKKVILFPSKLHSTSTSFMSRPWSSIFFLQMSKASRSRFLLISATRRSFSVATRTTGRMGGMTFSSGTKWLPMTHWANSRPLEVSTMTSCPISTVFPAAAK